MTLETLLDAPEVLQALDDSSIVAGNLVQGVPLPGTEVSNVVHAELLQFGIQPEVGCAVCHHLLHLRLALRAEALLLPVFFQALLGTSIARLYVWAELRQAIQA